MVAPALAAVLAAAAWLRIPGPVPAAAAAVAAAVALVAAGRRRPGPLLSVAVAAAALLALTLAGVEAARQRMVRGPASSAALEQRLARAGLQRLEQAVRAAERAADLAAGIDTADRETGLDRLEALLGRHEALAAVVVLGRAGQPDLWAGHPHVVPLPEGPPLAWRPTPFYDDLEVRRQRAEGGAAVAVLRLRAAGPDPAGGTALLAGLERRYGVPLELVPPGDPSAILRWPEGVPVVGLRASGLDGPAAPARLRERALPWIAGLSGLVLVVLSSAQATAPWRLAVLALLPAWGWLAGLGRLPALGLLFSPATYFSPALGPVSSSAGVLVLAGLFAFVGAVALWNRPPRRRLWLRPIGLGLVILSPYLLRELGRGITPPAEGVGLQLWFVWHLALLLPAGAVLIAGSALLGGDLPGRRWLSGLAVPLALAAALVGMLAYTGRPAWPAWYTAVWLPPLLLAARPAPRWLSVVVIGAVAGTGAGLMTWGGAVAGRTDLAMRDVAALGSDPDPLAEPVLMEAAASAPGISDQAGLFALWYGSAIRRQGYPTRLSLWAGDSLAADLQLDHLPLPDTLLAGVARSGRTGALRLETVRTVPGVHAVLAAPAGDSLMATLAIGPRSRLIPPSSLRRLVAPATERVAPYRLGLSPQADEAASAPRGRWRREGWALRATRPVTVNGATWEAGLLIPLGRPVSLVVRGALLLLLDAALVAVLWFGAERLLGVRRRPLPWRGLRRSWQGRLAVGLGAFAVLPAATLTAVALRQLAGESVQSRDQVLQRILRDAAPPLQAAAAGRPPVEALAEAAGRVDAGLALYVGGVLQAVSDPLLAHLGVFPALLEAGAYHSLHLEGDPTAAPTRNAGAARLGYATVGSEGRAPVVLASALPASEAELRERQADVTYLLLLLTLGSVLSALLLARAAARALGRPVEDLRDAALALGRGASAAVVSGDPPTEFAPVFTAFRRMAADVQAGRAALEAAQRRTERVLETVSVGVIALDRQGRVTLANRHASEATGGTLQPGGRLGALGEPWAPLVTEADRVLRHGGDGEVELEVSGRRLAARIGSLGTGDGGAVIAVADVTEATRAARILAWADVANQVAHAIKNPLTPMRLGVQHLQRVADERPADLPAVLADTAARILAEIDRLDGIARAFSRFAPPAVSEPLQEVEAGAILHEVAALYRLAPDLAVEVECRGAVRFLARRDELVETLVNLLDNARNAGARTVRLTARTGTLLVHDDGSGIAPEHLARVFEPRFSTTSSGAGLGLAVVRRLVESWGASVSVESVAGGGATFAIRFPPPGLNVSGRPA